MMSTDQPCRQTRPGLGSARRYERSRPRTILAIAALLLVSEPVSAEETTPGPPSTGYEAGLSHFENGAPDVAGMIWRYLANHGDPWAQYGVGLLHDPLGGAGAREAAAMAERWYLKAAKQGLVQAQDKLARLYARGAGPVARDPERAVLLWQTAARRGYALAVDNLLAFKVAESKKIALEHVEGGNEIPNTVSVGDLRAAVETAEYFDRPSRKRADAETYADSWYQLAAELGDPIARRRLDDAVHEKEQPEAEGLSAALSATGPVPVNTASTSPNVSSEAAADPIAPRTLGDRPVTEPPPMTQAPPTDPIYTLQLGSLLTPVGAAHEQARMRGLFPGVLADLEVDILHEGRYYRLRTNPALTLSEAGAKCRAIRSAGQACIVLRRP